MVKPQKCVSVWKGTSVTLQPPARPSHLASCITRHPQQQGPTGRCPYEKPAKSLSSVVAPLTLHQQGEGRTNLKPGSSRELGGFSPRMPVTEGVVLAFSGVLAPCLPGAQGLGVGVPGAPISCPGVTWRGRGGRIEKAQQADRPRGAPPVLLLG